MRMRLHSGSSPVSGIATGGAVSAFGAGVGAGVGAGSGALLATGAVALDRSDEAARQVSLITLQSAAADVVRLAILDGVASAAGVSTPAGEYGAYRPA